MSANRTKGSVPLDELETAIALACEVHRGKLDRGGEPYILHPLRVMLRFITQRERVTAVLHDVVEDGEVTLEDLRSRGFSCEVVTAVDCLTRRAREPYDVFIGRVCENELARCVKIADLRDNLDLTRLRDITDDDLQRVQKYHRALATLHSSR